MASDEMTTEDTTTSTAATTSVAQQVTTMASELAATAGKIARDAGAIGEENKEYYGKCSELVIIPKHLGPMYSSTCTHCMCSSVV